MIFERVFLMESIATFNFKPSQDGDGIIELENISISTHALKTNSHVHMKNPRDPSRSSGKSLSSIGFAKSKLVNLLTPAQRKEIIDFFHVFDTNGSGTIEMGELRILMLALGFNITGDETESLILEHFNISHEKLETISLSLQDFMILIVDKMVNFNSS